MQATFAQLAQDADAGQIAEKAVSTWRAIEVALSPIIGQRAVAALYRRSVALIRADHPWLTEHEDNDRNDDFVLLRDSLAQQSSAKARAAHQALLQAFENLLISLLGDSLAERLLKPVFDTSSSDDVAQEPSS